MSPVERRPDDESWTFYIYRCYDALDRLLYIGYTSDVVARMATHAASWSVPTSAYLNLHMARHATEPAVGYSAARQREREAIAAEAPLLNTLHNKGRGRNPLIDGIPVSPAAPKPPISDDLRAALDAVLGRFAPEERPVA